MEFREKPVVGGNSGIQDGWSIDDSEDQNHQGLSLVGGEKEKRDYFSIKSHGKQAAIEVAKDETKEGWKTIRIEAAKKQSQQSKKYNWGEKVSIQITKSELPIVIATLLGLLPYCLFKNHGGSANKWFSIENQREKFFIKVGQASTSMTMACPVPSSEALLMGHTALVQHCKNFDGLSCDAALSSISTMSKHLVSAGLNRPNTEKK